MSRTHRMHGVPMVRQSEKPERVYQDLTSLDRRAVDAMNAVVFPVASPQKRFAREVRSATKMTEPQKKFLWRLAWTYRRQIADSEVTDEAARVHDWANERPAVAAGERSDPIPVSACEPTSEDVASLPGLFDDMGSHRA